jgi:hypothetical protein
MTANNLQVIFPNPRQDVRAKVVDHTLVATFRSSNPPTVWRMDLEKNHSFAVAIQKRSTDWELGVMSPKGEFTVVARFDDRAAVDEAMAEVETAMFSNPNSTGIKVWRLSAMTAAMVFLILFGYLVIAGISALISATARSFHIALSPPASGIKLTIILVR